MSLLKNVECLSVGRLGFYLKVVMSTGSAFERTVPSSEAQVSPPQQAKDPSNAVPSQEDR